MFIVIIAYSCITTSNQNEVFFSDEDTGESSHGEEDESEAGETDEQDGDEFTFATNVAGAGGKFLMVRLGKVW